jgi:ADP-L-glycero-D-manno-heptose 6-epimerase
MKRLEGMIAITGAAGFIGSNLSARLAADNAELVLVDYPLTPEKLVNWSDLEGFRFLEHLDFLEALEAGSVAPEVIFHLGACSDTTETDWDYLRRNNVEYSQRLWSWCARHDSPFIYASSAATYGDGSRGFDDTTPPEQLRPLNLYGRSKNDFDIWARDQAAAGAGTPSRWAGLKFFNVYGPREAHKGRMASVVLKAYREIMASGSVALFRSNTPEIGDGEQRRDFVCVDDCVEHMLWLWRSSHPNGIYNSGTGRARTFLDLVHAVFAALDMEPDVRFIDMPADLSRQYQNFTEATMEKLRSTGYDEPAIELEDGVARYVAWLRRTSAVGEHREA